MRDNACRFSPRGAGVSLRARVLDEGVTVSVTDQGEGLDRSVATQAFIKRAPSRCSGTLTDRA